LCVYQDDPEVAAGEKLRLSVCVTVPQDTKVEGEIGKMSIPGGKYASAHFEIAGHEFQKAWDYMFGEWLPKSGYQPDDRPSYELCLNNPAEHPQHKHSIDIYLPVKLL
jgi:AraC family transcriptional regulator